MTLQHYGLRVGYGHVTTINDKRVLIRESVLEREEVCDDRIISRNEKKI